MDEPREVYLLEGLRYIPRIIELCDRNRLSPTYGCFDRSYWHYRTSDFPSGMYQEAVLPLALAYTLQHPKNPFFQQARAKELVEAGIDFTRRSSHREGSCDDYFPYERAAGAAAFSLYACTEAYLVLQLKNPDFVSFFKKRGTYLAGIGYRESGILSNHKALIILALFNVFQVSGEKSYKEMAEKKLSHLLSLQDPEGWFPEYEGCDPGYLNFTIDFLAKYYQKSRDESVLGPLTKAIEFNSFFVHPDGSFGGEYGSRNTFHFLPHGLELMGKQIPQAVVAADLFLESVKRNQRSYLDDDRIFCHYVYNFLQAYVDFCPRREVGLEPQRGNFSKYFERAGLALKAYDGHYAVLSAAKGGVAKIFRGNELLWSDCGLVGETTDGRQFISQVKGDFRFVDNGKKFTIEGYCYLHRPTGVSPLLFLLFRKFMFLIGRFLPANVVRSLLQKRMILKKKEKFPLRFKKSFFWDTTPRLEWELYLEDSRAKIKRLWIGTDSTFIYVATSQPYQPGAMKEWIDLAETAGALNDKGTALFLKELR